MGILDRFRRPRYEMPKVDNTAIPLTPDEVALLVEGLQRAHHLVKQARPGNGISSTSSNLADTMLHRAGIAAAVGNSTVPMLCRSLSTLDYTISDLHQYDPGSALGRRFEDLVSKMKVLAGAARVHGWTAKLTDTTVWEQEPDTSGVLGRLGIEP